MFYKMTEVIFSNLLRTLGDDRYKLAVVPRKFDSPKVCRNCKTVHLISPIGSMVCERNLHWFNCQCGSTLLNPDNNERRAYGSKKVTPQRI